MFGARGVDISTKDGEEQIHNFASLYVKAVEEIGM